jgi:hypothetical protein
VRALRDGTDERLRREDAATAQCRLSLHRPPPVSDAFPSEVDDSVLAIEVLWQRAG